MDGSIKTRQCTVSIVRITGLDNTPFGEGFPLKATLPELKLGGSECVVVSIRKMAADFVLEIGQHVEESVLQSQHSFLQDDIGTSLFGLCTTSIAWYLSSKFDDIRLIERQR